uniref:MX dynamin like GTPase 1 n=1 Tax=Crocodylus porosus TaxID=8502 RepID=A0A7M4FFD9_CROPO
MGPGQLPRLPVGAAQPGSTDSCQSALCSGPHQSGVGPDTLGHWFQDGDQSAGHLSMGGDTHAALNSLPKLSELFLGSEYEEKVHPCIDLIDSLRALGVEKVLVFPAIAMIGDQSSGKSSVLEALSGVALSRGSGIVTRCPLEVKLKKIHVTEGWKGKIKYKEVQELDYPSEVEKEIKNAQDLMAGKGVGISQELISLEISSPYVPDLTLIDLPGIAKIIKHIKTYITKQETINSVVVSSNIDIATTEALKMANEVDPDGERTLGVLTKPDLVDKGTERTVIDIVHNLSVPLRKGYMIVKSHGQQDTNDKLTLASAITREREFFEEHEYFGLNVISIFPCTSNLQYMNMTVLPGNGMQIFPLSTVKFCMCTIVTNNSRSVLSLVVIFKWQFPISLQKIKLFNQDFVNAVQGEECFCFNAVVKAHMKEEILKFENQKFESIVKDQIRLLIIPATTVLKNTTDTFTEIAVKHFDNFLALHRAAKSGIEDLKQKQEAAAENMIQTQFKMERIVYRQDRLYSGDLEEARKLPLSAQRFYSPYTLDSPKQYSINKMTYHLTAYFKVSNRLTIQIPLIICSYVLQDYGETLQNATLQLLQDKNQFNILLKEWKDMSSDRINLRESIKHLREAQQCLAKFSISSSHA